MADNKLLDISKGGVPLPVVAAIVGMLAGAAVPYFTTAADVKSLQTKAEDHEKRISKVEEKTQALSERQAVQEERYVNILQGINELKSAFNEAMRRKQ